MTVDKKIIQKAIQKLNLQGKIICIHSSLKSFGHVENGPRTIIDTFIEENCTILVPSFTDNYAVPPIAGLKPTRNGWDYDKFAWHTYGYDRIFNTDSTHITKENMGIIPYEIVKMSNRKRGNNPLSSFTAIGKYANALVCHQSPKNVWAPLEELYNLQGYVLLMGVNLDHATIIHYAEQLAGRNPFIRWANDSLGNTIPVSVGSCSKGFDSLSEILKPIESNITVGRSYWRCFPTVDMVNTCVSAILASPQITHCSNPDCDLCNDAISGGPIL